MKPYLVKLLSAEGEVENDCTSYAEHHAEAAEKAFFGNFYAGVDSSVYHEYAFEVSRTEHPEVVWVVLMKIEPKE